MVQRAARWLESEEITVSGDWAVRRPALSPGGWAFEFENDGYPDTDDTAEVLLALRRVPEAARRNGDCVRLGPTWHGLDGRDAVQGRRLGRFRRRQHPRTGVQAALLRLRRRHRSAVRRRHRSRRRSDGRRGTRRHHRLSPRGRMAAARAGKGRFLVRTMGLQLRLRGRSGGPGSDRGGGGSVVAGDPAGQPVAAGTPERRRRLGRGHALLRRPRLGRPRRVHCLADGVGAARTAGGEGRSGAASSGGSAGSSRTRRPTARGTSRSSPAPVSRATSTSTITCTGMCFRSRRWAGIAGRAAAHG